MEFWQSPFSMFGAAVLVTMLSWIIARVISRACFQSWAEAKRQWESYEKWKESNDGTEEKEDEKETQVV